MKSKNRSVRTFCRIVREITEQCLHPLDRDIEVKFGEPGEKPEGGAGFWHLPVKITCKSFLLLECRIAPTLFEVRGDGDGGGSRGQRWCHHFAVGLIEKAIRSYMRSPVFEKRILGEATAALKRMLNDIDEALELATKPIVF